jgi:tetratricopeptide (TPR) repeat protein
MAPRTLYMLAAAAWLALETATLPAAEPPTLLPATGLSESRTQTRAALLAELAAVKTEADAREIEHRIWKFWLQPADEESRRLLDASKAAQLSFDYGHALVALKALVKHAPRFAEGWNQLAYVLFLSGGYDASLEALDRTLELEPMHYAALAGKGIILIQQGKEELAQIPLKMALAINPWLKERNLIVKDSDRKI